MIIKHLISAAVTLVVGFGYFYVALPALNWRSKELWSMLFLLAVVYIVSYFWSSIFTKNVTKKKTNTKVFENGTHANVNIQIDLPKNLKIALGAVAAVALILLLVVFSSSAVFNAGKYQDMLTVNESDFAADIAELPLSQIPVVDKSTAERLASRKIGEVVELVSQFNLSVYNTQINFNEKPVRVLPLEYADMIKWFVNTSEGIPYYVKVDMATQATELVELDNGMRYSPSEYFARDLMRHVRFNFPTKMIDHISFEIDDSGAPYWILPYYTYTIGVVGGKDIAGIILCNAVTGELQNIEVSAVPQWIDNVYSADMLVEQADNWGKYTNGFINSIIAQKNVVVTTDGYNYIAQDDDVWLYTGITSVVADESNIGFILVNKRTKEARTYPINGAEEYSAMDSAIGAVQEKNYTATFPILINVENVPTYFISLKDNAGLVKMYSFVSVSNYQTVGVSDTLSGAMEDYVRMLKANGIIDSSAVPTPDGDEYEITADSIAEVMVGGNTVYYIKSGDRIFTADINLGPELPFILEVGKTYVVRAKDAGNGSFTITSIKLK